MNKIVLIFVLTSAFFSLTGCQHELKDGYQVGDLTHFNLRKADAIHQHRVNYCSSVSSSLTRETALAAIQMQYPLIPADGICLGLIIDNPAAPLPANRIRDDPCIKQKPLPHSIDHE